MARFLLAGVKVSPEPQVVRGRVRTNGRGLGRGTPSPRLLGAAVLGNAAVLATWVVSRTVGMPIGPHRTPEAIGAVDLTAAAAEMLLPALSAVWLVLRTPAPQPQPVGVSSAFPVG